MCVCMFSDSVASSNLPATSSAPASVSGAAAATAAAGSTTTAALASTGHRDTLMESQVITGSSTNVT